MKLVLISDTHGLHDQVKVPDGDVLIFAGDLGGYGTKAEVWRFATWMGKQKHAHKIAIAGNHDWALYKPSEKWRARGIFQAAHVTYLEDSGITIDGVTFWGTPWTPNFYDWAFMYPRSSEMAKTVWNKVPEGTDVLITHGPPRGILDPAYSDPSGHAGCDELYEQVTERIKPKVHVFGHLHDGYGKLTVHVNPPMKRPREDILFVNAAICNDFYQPVNAPIEVEI